jgi:MFS family permease
MDREDRRRKVWRGLSSSRWILALVCAIYFITYMDRVNLATAAGDIQREFHLTNTQLGLIFSAYSYPYAIVQLFGGRLADAFGPRLVLGISSLTFSLATVFTGFAGGFFSLIGLRAMLGLGEGPSLAAATRVIINWLPASRWSFAQGIAHSFSRIANSVTPLLVAFLIVKTSWRGSFFVVGALSLIWAVIWILSFRNHPPGCEGRAGNGEPQHRATNTGKHNRTAMWRLFLRMLPVTITDFCYGWTLWVCLNWLPSFFRQNYGLSLESSALFTSGIFLAGIVGNMLGGIVSDLVLARTGSLVKARRDLIVAGLAGSMTFLIPVLAFHNLTVVAIAMTLAFFSMELVIAPLWATPMDIAPRHAGTAGGFMNFGSAVAGIISPWAFGRIADLTGSWHLPFALSAILMLGGTVSAFWIRPNKPFFDGPMEGNQPTEKLIAVE